MAESSERQHKSLTRVIGHLDFPGTEALVAEIGSIQQTVDNMERVRREDERTFEALRKSALNFPDEKIGENVFALEGDMRAQAENIQRVKKLRDSFLKKFESVPKH